MLHNRGGQPRPRRCIARMGAGLAALLAVTVVAAGGSTGGHRPSTVTAAAAPSHVPPPRSGQTATPASSGVTPMPRSTPVRVRIPAIGVDAALVKLGLNADGTMQVPTNGVPAGWYTEGPTPGELGPAVIAGHVDWGGSPGVFYRLRQMKPHTEVTITRADGTTAVFRVPRVERFPKAQFPTDRVYGDIDHAGLRLITCGGAFNREARSYVDNIVVFADLVDHHDR